MRVAEDHDIQGSITIRIKDRPYVDNLHVRRETGSRGVGRRLMQAAARRLVDRGYNATCLGVAAARAGHPLLPRARGPFGATTTETLLGEEIDVTSVEWDDLLELSAQTSRDVI